MRFSPDFLDDIRGRVPISTVVATRVTFDSKKSNASRGDYWGCCPFHGEKTPSFHCDDGRGRYHCFGCGESGDHFRFLMTLDGLGFTEAVERVADMAGVPMPKADPQMEQREARKATLYDVMEMATQFFEAQLQNSQGNEARQYLQNRQLPQAIQKRFRLGFAPNSKTALKDHLLAKGVSVKQMGAAGLIVTGADIPSPYDRFRHRVIFPIADLKGRIVAFGGRALSTEVRAKYLNSPETELFHKGNLLYNGGEARRAAQAKGGEAAKPILVVEGYMDVIALAKAGIDNAVAPLGTALTDEQLQLLWRMSNEPVLCFDGDGAGINAAYRAIDRALPLLKAGVSLRFVTLPNGKDPDDIIRDNGGQAFLGLVSEAQPLIEMLWQREVNDGLTETPEQRAALEKRLTTAAFLIKDESLRHYYLQDIRNRLRDFFRPKFQPFQKGQKSQQGNFGKKTLETIAAGPSQNLNNSDLAWSSRTPMASRDAAILLTLANHPALWHENFEALAALEFAHDGLQDFHRAMLNILAEWCPDDGSAMHELLIKRGQKAILDRISMMMRNLNTRSCTLEAPIEDAREALKQALYLYSSARNLHKRLREIEVDLLANPTEEKLALLMDVRAELERSNATEALIEGFGAWEKEKG
ncbi:DNA primase [Bartonella sp. HY038]|uniref:DNA primase n=1 Tax=Bartonella sp. HY038 TaxID=2759660 RepID=UPI0015FC313D|nr:DNA primase [Bartonella sp. HY038]